MVSFRPGGAKRFGVYWMSIDGQRELLVADETISCNQPVSLAVRPEAPVHPCRVDYRSECATVYLQDVYQGPGLTGVDRRAAKSLRVVALEFRAAGIGSNLNHGPAGDALASTPISIEGAWDVKTILGTTTIHDDGSACFTVPARTPLYFQVLDEKDQMIQTMRSWVSLQPGEVIACIGCHENKNVAPAVTTIGQALKSPPQALTPFCGPPRGFSFVREIQPILDTHCVRCHYLDETPRYAVYASGRAECTASRGIGGQGSRDARVQPPRGSDVRCWQPAEMERFLPSIGRPSCGQLDQHPVRTADASAVSCGRLAESFAQDACRRVPLRHSPLEGGVRSLQCAGSTC